MKITEKIYVYTFSNDDDDDKEKGKNKFFRRRRKFCCAVRNNYCKCIFYVSFMEMLCT